METELGKCRKNYFGNNIIYNQVQVEECGYKAMKGSCLLSTSERC